MCIRDRLLSMYGVEEGTFSRWFPVIAALLIVYTVRFRMRKKISAKQDQNNTKDMDE